MRREGKILIMEMKIHARAIETYVNTLQASDRLLERFMRLEISRVMRRKMRACRWNHIFGKFEVMLGLMTLLSSVHNWKGQGL